MALNTAITLLLAANAVLAAPIDPIVVERRGNLPTPIAASTARTYLAQLKVETESNSPAYDRDLFNHWITISGTCNARETVLKRDGSNVVTSSACASTSGSWYSDYDGLTFTVSSEVDIDHVVPLVRYCHCYHCHIVMPCINIVKTPADRLAHYRKKPGSPVPGLGRMLAVKSSQTSKLFMPSQFITIDRSVDPFAPTYRSAAQ
jgi:hypothetical protein